MGLMDNKITLVEVNNPYSCGWYGKKHELYAKWIVEGWHSIVNEVKYENDKTMSR